MEQFNNAVRSNAVTFVMSSLLIFLLLAPGFLILMTCAGASLFGMEASLLPLQVVGRFKKEGVALTWSHSVCPCHS